MGVSTRHILVVDDDQSILDLVRMVLEDEGFGVATATDGEEALQTLAEFVPNLILLDMRMPGMNGWEFAHAYKLQYSSHVPIVVITAGRDAADKAAQIGAAGFISKPFDLSELVNVVRSYCPNGNR